MSKDYSSPDGTYVTLKIHLHPRAAHEEINGLRGDSVKVRVTAPALEDKANAALKKFVAKKLKIAVSHVEIIAGHHSREKLLRISGVTKAEVEKAFGIPLPPG
ncbi:MAG: hypothetical protein A2Z19_05945 [Deltaproteobacteria bacterium RBG_16_54_18]|jgi:uncharacterized protein (TIGR00251 family)|nr:MAG: hypothetical protein A2Z19_05945 [Deltaproteobacteria bacterium RBG_16_54_18]